MTASMWATDLNRADRGADADPVVEFFETAGVLEVANAIIDGHTVAGREVCPDEALRMLDQVQPG